VRTGATRSRRSLAAAGLALLAAAAAACAGGSSSSSAPATLAPGDVAVVGKVHITRRELDRQVALDVRSLELGYQSCKGGTNPGKNQELCKTVKQAVPKPGTVAYRTNVVGPVVAFLVADASLGDLGQQLAVDVTPAEIKAQIQRNVQQFYGGDEAAYRADMRRHRQTQADVRQQVQFTLLERDIDAKLKGQVHVAPAAVRAYYESHRQIYETDAATRTVDYVLVADRAAALRAHTALAAGKSFAAASQGAISSSAQHEPFVATEGRLDAGFQKAAFGLPTNALSGPVAVDRSYAHSALRGRCTPTCFFVIRPTGAIVKGGSPEPFAAVEAQIHTQLLDALRTQHERDVIARFEKREGRVTRYASGYAPPATTG
jgi:PPIC-type PPIASE domain